VGYYGRNLLNLTSRKKERKHNIKSLARNCLINNDVELNRITIYYVLGDCFGWLPSEVDNMDNTLVEDLVLLCSEIKKVKGETNNG